MTARVRCDQAAAIVLTGRLNERLRIRRAHRKPRTRTVSFRLGPLHATVKANTTATLYLRLPKRALTALAHHTPEAATLTLTATNANGTGHATATVRRLRAL